MALHAMNFQLEVRCTGHFESSSNIEGDLANGYQHAGCVSDSDLSLAVSAGIYHDIQHFLCREALLWIPAFR